MLENNGEDARASRRELSKTLALNKLKDKLMQEVLHKISDAVVQCRTELDDQYSTDDQEVGVHVAFPKRGPPVISVNFFQR